MTVLSAAELKFNRALRHREELVSEIKKFEAASPWEIEEVVSGEWVHHIFRQHNLIPSSLALVLGDICHNLRSSLDSALFHYLQTKGVLACEKHRAAVQFPIFANEQLFLDFFKRASRRHWSPLIAETLYEFQPFYVWKLSDTLGDWTDDIADVDPLFRLHTLNNLDKHRSLNVISMALQHVAYSSGKDLPDMEFRWGSGMALNGEILFKTRGRDLGQTEMMSSFAIVIADDPLFAHSNPTDVKSEINSSVDQFISRTAYVIQRIEGLV